MTSPKRSADGKVVCRLCHSTVDRNHLARHAETAHMAAKVMIYDLYDLRFATTHYLIEP